MTIEGSVAFVTGGDRALAGDLEVTTDDFTRQVKASCALGVEARYPQLARA